MKKVSEYSSIDTTAPTYKNTEPMTILLVLPHNMLIELMM